jgi:two-component system, OmpR family, response regulator
VPPNVPAPIRILCVDDNRDAAESLALILQVVGLEAEAAFDGPSALRALERFRPHACVSDINMPGMDGYELARHVRRWAGRQPLLLVAMTARTTDEDRRKAAEAGFDLHLSKPADPMALVETVVTFGNRLASTDARVRGTDGTTAGGHQRA